MKLMASEIADLVDDGADVFLPGVGYGYVIEAENEVECSAFTGRYNAVLGTFTVLTFNDQDGNENYLLVSPDTMMEVSNS